jgi:hypothetical protein
MKINYKYILACLMLMVVGTSCNNMLDIKPRALVDSGLVFTSTENLRSALYGAYSEVKGTFNGPQNGELYGGDLNIMSELLSADGNVHWGGSFSNFAEFEDKSVITTNTTVTGNWVRAYTALNILNNVLANLNVADDEEERARIEGEAKCIRGMIYFELVRFWSKPWGTGTESTDPGVPLVLKPINTVADADALVTIGRSTVTAVYTQVISDLTDAKELLEEFGKNGSNFSTYVASAILSRVYLQRGEFELAAEEADRVIGSGEYSLVAEPLAAFNNTANTKEDVFAIQQTSLSNAGTSNGGISTFYANLNGLGRGDMQVQEQHFDLYENGDTRAGLQEDLPVTAVIVNVEEMYYLGIGTQNSGFIQTAKWGDPNLNIPVVRLAEMYLTRAEANFEAGTSIGAAPEDDINLIRNRAGLEDLSFALTIDEIRLERQRELAFEGFRLHDFRRWKLDMDGLAFDDPNLILPIPERELEVYDIQQNDAYLN